MFYLQLLKPAALWTIQNIEMDTRLISYRKNLQSLLFGRRLISWFIWSQMLCQLAAVSSDYCESALSAFEGCSVSLLSLVAAFKQFQVESSPENSRSIGSRLLSNAIARQGRGYKPANED